MDVLERDFYEERRRKWRRSAFWKGVLVTVVGLFVILTVINIDLSDLWASWANAGHHTNDS